MHVYFSGIGGSGIGPLALLAHQAGYTVSGSDKQHSSYIDYLKQAGIANIHVGQTVEKMRTLHDQLPIDWFVYSSAIPREQPNHPELLFAHDEHIKASKRDGFLSAFLRENKQKMIAIAGTHGKTTTTAMAIWLCKQAGIPISYSVGAKVSFGSMAEFNRDATFFVYEADEFDRNFLSFSPALSIISGIGYDHPDIYPTIEAYNEAFIAFIEQSDKTILWQQDYKKLGSPKHTTITVLPTNSDTARLQLPGTVNRQNAFAVARGFEAMGLCDFDSAIAILQKFPGVSRRFEKITDNLYSDYAHTPEKIAGALQIAQETTNTDFVVVYEGLHNTRQHFIRKDLETLFAPASKLYIVPSYLAREDESLEMLTPEKLTAIVHQPTDKEAAHLNESLKDKIAAHLQKNQLVLCLSAGGGGSLDEWLRKNFSQ